MSYIWIWLGAHAKQTLYLYPSGVLSGSVCWWVGCARTLIIRLWFTSLYFVIECKAWPLIAPLLNISISVYGYRSLYSSSYIKIFKFFNLKRAIAQSADCLRYKYIYVSYMSYIKSKSHKSALWSIKTYIVSITFSSPNDSVSLWRLQFVACVEISKKVRSF